MIKLIKEQAARVAYDCFCEAMKDSGEKVRPFDLLGKHVRGAWVYAVSVAYEMGEKYYEEKVREAIDKISYEKTDEGK